MANKAVSLISILNAISNTAHKYKASTYVYKQAALFLATKNINVENSPVVHIGIHADEQFPIYPWFKDIQSLTGAILEDITSSTIQFYLNHQHYNCRVYYGKSPTNRDWIMSLSTFTVDTVVYDINNQSAIDHLNICSQYSDNQTIVLDWINTGQLLSKDVYAVCEYVGNIRYCQLNENDLLGKTRLADVINIGNYGSRLFEYIFNSIFPGAIIKILAKFVDGALYVKQGIELYVQSLGLEISDFDTKQISNEEVLDVIDQVYAVAQNNKDRDTKRAAVEHSLRLLTDQAKLNIPATYVKRVSAFGGTTGRCCFTVNCFSPNPHGSPVTHRRQTSFITCAENILESECNEDYPDILTDLEETICPPNPDCSPFDFPPCAYRVINTKWCENTACTSEQCGVDSAPSDPSSCGYFAYPISPGNVAPAAVLYDACHCSDFGGNYCPNGNCTGCQPSQCVADGGDACCCCHSVDIVRSIQSRCYDKIYFSCNRTGTAPGPPSDKCICEDFAESCTQCVEACDMALGMNGLICDDIYGGRSSPPDWWNFPQDVGPCACTCAQPDATGCNLTCVTCSGLTCTADVNITSNNCFYQFALTPGQDCCGVPVVLQTTIITDVSSAMSGLLTHVYDQINLYFDLIESAGFTLQMGLVVYGDATSTRGAPKVALQLTTDRDAFNTAFSALVASGDIQPSFDAVEFAIQNFEWKGNENHIVLIANTATECTGCDPADGEIGDGTKQPSPQNLNKLLSLYNIQFFTADSPDILREELVNLSGGSRFELIEDFGPLIFGHVHLPSGFGGSCDCLDYTPIYVEMCTEQDVNGNCISSTTLVPIRKCVREDHSDCQCDAPYTLDVCGEVIIVEPDPDTINLICCHEIDGGCSCPSTTNPPEGCCGLSCRNLGNVCELYQNKEDAVNDLWCECWEKARLGIDGFILQDVNCDACVPPDPNNAHYAAIVNCCIGVPDGFGGHTTICRANIVAEVDLAWATCSDTGGDDGNDGDGGGGEPPVVPPNWIASCQPTCDRDDECISSSATVPNDCSSGSDGCTSITNPSVVVLNNGIGLVAYESQENPTTIHVQQFHTSLRNKLLPNRKNNLGRLQNINSWTDNPRVAKLYYYDDLPTHFLNGISTSENPSQWQDSIGFKTGPLQNQCFPLYISSESDQPYGKDETGTYLQFLVVDGTKLSNAFPTNDDVYNIEWFISDSADDGLIGDAVPNSNTPGSDLFIDNRTYIDNLLQLPSHYHNGKAVPVANPSITALTNYMNATENSHFIYIAYQAFEDNKWNIYVRQVRLSEYKQSEIAATGLSSLDLLNISDIIGRVICVDDFCEQESELFVAERSITMQAFLMDGREVYNSNLTGTWNELCPGLSASNLPKEKVFIKFTHSISLNHCPNQNELNSLFYNWAVGDEFSLPVNQISPATMFSLLKKADDTAIEPGIYSPATTIGDIEITSSTVAVAWYDLPSSKTWLAANSSTLVNLLNFKGADIAEPIPINNSQIGHATRPVIKANLNNDIFVAYESTENELTQIHLAGTATPQGSLPLGVFRPRNIDRSLNYFYGPSDFTYRVQITNEAMNQMPDMFIDGNDIVHLTWQSNINRYWEIYYAQSDNNFVLKRITHFNSKSFRPKICGDASGRLFIVWHDNRFNNWEVMLAYYPGTRIRPLMEQDPYLASIRNTQNGYSHFTDLVVLPLQHSYGETVCVSNLELSFYYDRLHEQLAFNLRQDQWPSVFNIPNLQDDTSRNVLYSLANWTYENNGDGTTTLVSPMFDSDLTSSLIDRLVIHYGTVTGNVLISFRASDDNVANASWSQYVDITSLVSDENTLYSTFNLPPVAGRYKQVRLNLDQTEVDITSVYSIGADADDIYTDADAAQADGTIKIGNNYKAFLRFALDIPTTSPIVSASLTFKAAESTSTAVSVRIFLIDSNDAADLDFNDPAVSDASNDTGTYVNWNSVEEWTLDSTYTSVDITALVQEYVNRIGYTSGQYIGIKIVDNGSDSGAYRSFYDHESGDTVASLSVEYLKGSDFLPITIYSLSPNRLCIGANEIVTGYLDLSPAVRVDSDGNETIEVPLNAGFRPNQTYFVAITGTNNAGAIISFDDPKISVSCESCTEPTSNWPTYSCSYLISLFNASAQGTYYNARVQFYADQNKQDLILEYNTFDNLDKFTIDGNGAQSVWTESGYYLDAYAAGNLSIWPSLDTLNGLLCGITYWVQVYICSSANAAGGCAKEDLSFFTFERWMCSCDSLRNGQTMAENYRNETKWVSSGDGKTDTRITDTMGGYSLNPSIQFRDNHNGIIIYETNRDDADKLKYSLYASVFTTFPAYNMYASAAESIISRFDEIFVKSDIKLCDKNDCSTSTNNPLFGRSASFALDQYDNLFLAYEYIPNQDQCEFGTINRQRFVKIHRCGLDADQLFIEKQDASIQPMGCTTPLLTGQIAPDVAQDFVFKRTIHLARVVPEFVNYHITRDNIDIAVVKSCSLQIEVVAEPDTVAVRFQNEVGNWSSWMPLTLNVGSNSAIFDWKLSPISGMKYVNIQTVAYQGMGRSFALKILADYDTVQYRVKLYKPSGNDTSDNAPFAESIFVEENLLPMFNSTPVAGLGLVPSSFTSLQSQHVYVEIYPETTYMDKFTQDDKTNNVISPVVDFIHQGYGDQYGIETYYARRAAGEEVFRSRILVNLDNMGQYKDGTSFIVPHFKEDCSEQEGNTSSTLGLIKDSFNINKSGVRQIDENNNLPVFDILQDDRNSIGEFKYYTDIRSGEDPYFIFGDPNYRIDN